MLHAPAQYVSGGLFVPARESPQRATELLLALQDGGHSLLTPAASGMTPMLAVHDAEYLDFLETAFETWRRQTAPSGPMAIAQCYAMRAGRTRPNGFDGRLGYYLSGNSVPVGPDTWRSIRSAADCAVAAADAVAGGAPKAYALCRPPGHHAYADLAGGFCYINNAAVAAERLRRTAPWVSVLDVDVHHGGGTQAIFWRRPDVQFVSLHADPNEVYPWYAGYARGRGEGDGAGYTLNLPMSLCSGDDAFLMALQAGVAAIHDYDPAAIVLSLGLNAFKDDPSNLLQVTTAGFEAIGHLIGGLKRPTVIIQEGGYAIDTLRRNLTSFLGGFLSSRGA